MKKRKIIVTAHDHARLSDMIAFGNFQHEHEEMDALQSELKFAEIVLPEAIPSDVITMNSRAELLDLDTHERMEFAVVFPDEADLSEDKISVLAPVGTAMLGYRVGDSFQCPAPYGMRRLQVVAVIFQPEAAHAMAQ